MKIGIFDSGMGGLSVLHRALRMLPEADFLYYADEEHVPYGEKTREQVRGYIDEILEIRRGFLMEANPRTPSSATPDRSSAF